MAKKASNHSPLHLRRDTILENDPCYRQNAADLCRRILSGKVPKSMFRALQQHMAMAALRRAGFSAPESERMMAA